MMRAPAALLALLVILLLPAARAAAEPAGPDPAAGWRLKGAVLLSRHGMRGPTRAVDCSGGAERHCMNAIAELPWPDLGVAAGHLTLAGYERSRSMGRFYRALYAGAGLLPDGGCPAADRIAFAADTDERTIMTAGAVMDGMFPGCRLHPIAIAPDRYRAAERLAACGYDPKAASAASRRLAGGSWAALLQGELREPLAALGRVLGPMQPAACTAFGLAAPCSLADIPATAEDPGPLQLASAAAEQFLMQFGGGLPEDRVGWGRLPAATGLPLPQAIAFVNRIHAVAARYRDMPQYQARKLGSAPLHLVLQALADAAAGSGPAFTFLAAHDTTIARVAALLGLSWWLEGYNPDQVPPGGALAFELWQQEAAEPVLRLAYYAQTPEQLRHDTPLDAATPPATAILSVTGCSGPEPDLCPWPAFQALARQVIEPACLPPG